MSEEERESLIVNGYCTLEQVKEFLRLNKSNSVSDNLLDECINVASRYIDEYTRTFFYEVEVGNIREISNRPFRCIPVQDKTIIELRYPVIDDLIITDMGVVIPSDKYSVYNNGKEILVDRWGIDSSTLILSGKFGCVTVPGMITHACIEIASVYSGLYKHGVASNGVLVPDVLVKDIPARVINLLDIFKVRWI